MPNENFNRLAKGSSYWDPEHMSYENNEVEKYQYAQELGGKYTTTRDEHARVHLLNLKDGHPHLHDGHRTIDDIKNDLDTGHKLMGNGKSPQERTLANKLSAWHPQNSHRVDSLHREALEAGYAANSHIYMDRQMKAGWAKEAQERRTPPTTSQQFKFTAETPSTGNPTEWDTEPSAPARTPAPKAKAKSSKPKPYRNPDDTFGAAVKHVVNYFRGK